MVDSGSNLEKDANKDFAPLIRLPQILGAALSANVFVVIAHSATVIDWHHFLNGLVLLLIFLLNLKDGIDDFKSYEGSYETFSLAPTVSFRIISYVALAGAAVKANDLQTATGWLATYFGVLVLWSASSVLRRLQNEKTDENQTRLKRRKWWMCLYTVCGVLVFSIPYFGLVWSLVAVMDLLIFYTFDCIECETFENKINEAL